MLLLEVGRRSIADNTQIGRCRLRLRTVPFGLILVG